MELATKYKVNDWVLIFDPFNGCRIGRIDDILLKPIEEIVVYAVEFSNHPGKVKHFYKGGIERVATVEDKLKYTDSEYMPQLCEMVYDRKCGTMTATPYCRYLEMLDFLVGIYFSGCAAGAMVKVMRSEELYRLAWCWYLAQPYLGEFEVRR